MKCSGQHTLHPIDPAAAPYFHRGPESNPGVVFIHGLTSSPTEVRPIADYLRRTEPQMTLSCPLLPGHGTNLENLRRTSLREWSETVEVEVDRVAQMCGLVSIVGVSMGAVLGAEAAMADSRVRSLIMLAPVFGLRPSSALFITIMRHVVRFTRKSRRSLDNHCRKGLYSYDRYPLDSLMHLMALGRRTRTRLGKLVTPTLIAVGRHDRYVPPSTVESLRREIGTKRLEVFLCPDSGHVLPHEPDAPRLMKAIRQFIVKHHSTRSADGHAVAVK